MKPWVVVLGIVRSRDFFEREHGAGDGGVPSVIAERGGVCLVDLAADEGEGGGGGVEHVGEGSKVGA